MNQKQKEINKRKALDLVKYKSRLGSRVNYCYYWRSNTWEHEMVKWQIFGKLRNQGYDLMTECDFESGGRADIYVLDFAGEPLAIEIETPKSKKHYKEKTLSKHKYPCPIVIINTKDFNIDDFEL